MKWRTAATLSSWRRNGRSSRSSISSGPAGYSVTRSFSMVEIFLTRRKWKSWALSTRALGANRPPSSSPSPPVMEPERQESARIIEVAAGLVFRDGRLLITQRPAGTHLAGFWEFPGGKREPNETYEECLRRELWEELAIEVSVGPLVET